jgi:hypothetical protein
MTGDSWEKYSPLDVLTELAVEGTSSLVEAQRTLLDLAKQENDILRLMELAREAVETFTRAQQKFLEVASRQFRARHCHDRHGPPEC